MSVPRFQKRVNPACDRAGRDSRFGADCGCRQRIADYEPILPEGSGSVNSTYVDMFLGASIYIEICDRIMVCRSNQRRRVKNMTGSDI